MHVQRVSITPQHVFIKLAAFVEVNSPDPGVLARLSAVRVLRVDFTVIIDFERDKRRGKLQDIFTHIRMGPCSYVWEYRRKSYCWSSRTLYFRIVLRACGRYVGELLGFYFRKPEQPAWAVDRKGCHGGIRMRSSHQERS